MTTTNTEYFVKLLKSSKSMLARWSGADGELLELTRSHKCLKILLRAEEKPGNLLIACIDPITIKAPIRWSNARITIVCAPLPGNDEGFLVTDESADVAILCGALEVKENAKL